MKKKYGLIGFLLGLGICYYVLVRHTHLGIPCLFYKVFHLKCPGCGITRMVIHLSKFEWKEAMQDNYFLFFAGPVILYLCCFDFFGKKTKKKSKWFNVVAVICLIMAIVWMIVRNCLKI